MLQRSGSLPSPAQTFIYATMASFREEARASGSPTPHQIAIASHPDAEQRAIYELFDRNGSGELGLVEFGTCTTVLQLAVQRKRTGRPIDPAHLGEVLTLLLDHDAAVAPEEVKAFLWSFAVLRLLPPPQQQLLLDDPSPRSLEALSRSVAAGPDGEVRRADFVRWCGENLDLERSLAFIR